LGVISFSRFNPVRNRLQYMRLLEKCLAAFR
jgi:hypothetical protein